MPQFREKLYNDIKNDTKPGNLLAVQLSDDIEQVTIDSSVFDVRYYYVQTPDSVLRKTDYYEVLADKHYLIFKVNDSVYQTYQYRTGEAISDTPQYNETGMEFSGWTDDIPAVMPDYDVIITGTATAVDYTIAYFINDTFVHYEVHNYNDTLTEYVPDAQEGYTFSGWTDFPVSGKMPAENIQVHGTLVENDTYTLTYYVGEEVYAEFYYKEGEEVRSAAEPEVETGYTFVEWIDEPDVMPGYDTSVNSSIIVNQYVLDYYVDSSLWKSLLYPYNSSIVPQTFERPNYVFLGWDNEPEVMPAMDYNVQGSTQQVLYNLAFYTDTSSLYAEYQLAYGEQVPQIECNKEGYVFNSWNPAVPSTMPAYDISTYATYIANSYQLKFVTVNYYDQIENLTYDLAVGQKIDASLYPKPEQYFKYKYVSENDIPEVMPASDLIIYGRYTLIDASTEGFIQWYIDGEKLTNGVYAYDTSVYAPISQEENFIYLWGQYAAFTMPHQRRMDIYGERGIIPGQYSRIQWWLDDDTVPVLTQVVEWDTQVTAPVSEEDDYNYDWGTYSSFTMPRFNVDAHGTRVAKVIPHTVYWYLDSSLFTSGTYYAGTTINSPVSSEANYNYDWGAYASFSMPNYDISVYGERVSKSEPVVDSGTVTWYLDNVLFRQGTYDYDTYVMSPSSSDIKYVYEWGDYELFEMPHNDISVYGTSTKVGGTVTWYLDNAYYSSGDYLYDASVNSPVSIEANYNYNWGNYDTFRMPHYDTSVHGVREAKVVPVSSHTVYWYIDSSLIDSSICETGSTVVSPISQEANYNYYWGNYASFVMPDYDTSVYGSRVSKVSPVDPSDIDSSLFGFSLESFKNSNSTLITRGYCYPTSASYRVYNNDSSIPVIFEIENLNGDIDRSRNFTGVKRTGFIEFQLSDDGQNWVSMPKSTYVNTAALDTSIDAEGYYCVPDFAFFKYIRLNLLGIDDTPLGLPSFNGRFNISSTDDINDDNRYKNLFLMITTPSNGSNPINSKWKLFGDFEGFYAHLLRQLNNVFDTYYSLCGLRLCSGAGFIHAHDVLEKTAANWITSGEKMANGMGPGGFTYGPDLITPPHNIATDLFESCYEWRFNRCYKLTEPIELPATSLARACYKYMFSECHSLTYAPVLPAWNLTPECYTEMFWKCRNLTTASALNASYVPTAAYALMYEYCSSLVNPPIIGGTYFESTACEEMFGYCTSLTSRAVIDSNAYYNTDNSFKDMYIGCTSLPPEE